MASTAAAATRTVNQGAPHHTEASKTGSPTSVVSARFSNGQAPVAPESPESPE
jgi:hypothetical protein